MNPGYILELNSVELDSLLYALTIATNDKESDTSRLSSIILAVHRCCPSAIRSRRLVKLLSKRRG